MQFIEVQSIVYNITFVVEVKLFQKQFSIYTESSYNLKLLEKFPIVFKFCII